MATYDVDVPGKVSWGGEGASSSTATVVAGKTSLKQLEMEPPVKITAQFQQPDGSSASLELRLGREREAARTPSRSRSRAR